MAEYIEREAAIDRLEKLFLLQAATARAIIEAIPAADVVSVQHGYDTRGSRYFHCSVCDYGVADVYEDGPTLVFEKQKEWNYCPNCGAKMDGEA